MEELVLHHHRHEISILSTARNRRDVVWSFASTQCLARDFLEDGAHPSRAGLVEGSKGRQSPLVYGDPGRAAPPRPQ